MGKPRILFILHLPPPVHGASLVGSFLRESALVEEAFETRWINLAVSTRLSEVRRFTFGKIFTILRLLREVRATVRTWKPDLVYMTPSSTMPALLKDVLLVLGMKGCRKVFHFHNKGVSRRQDRFLDDRLYRILFRDDSQGYSTFSRSMTQLPKSPGMQALKPRYISEAPEYSFPVSSR